MTAAPVIRPETATGAESPLTTEIRTRYGVRTRYDVRSRIDSRHWAIPLALLAAASLWTLWRIGIGLDPINDRFEHIARTWPHSVIPERDGYIMRSPVGLLAYRLQPFRGLPAFAVLHALTLLGVYLALAGWFVRRLGWERGLIGTTLVVLAPLTAVLLPWIGMYDAFTLAGWVALLWSLRTPWPVQAAVGFYLGIQNAEQGVVGLVILWLLRPVVARDETAFRPGVALAGCLAGKVVLESYLRANGAVSGNRLTWLSDWTALEPTVSSGVAMLPLILWSGLGGLWFFLPMLPRPSWTPELKVRVLAAGGVWLAMSMLAADHSRLLAVTSVAVLVLGIKEIVTARLSSLELLLRNPAWWILVIAPPTIVWVNAVLPLGWHGIP